MSLRRAVCRIWLCLLSFIEEEREKERERAERGREGEAKGGGGKGGERAC